MLSRSGVVGATHWTTVLLTGTTTVCSVCVTALWKMIKDLLNDKPIELTSNLPKNYQNLSLHDMYKIRALLLRLFRKFTYK